MSVDVDELLQLSLGSNKIFASLPCAFDLGHRRIYSISPASAGNYPPAQLSEGTGEVRTKNLSPNTQPASARYTSLEDITMIWGQ